jgi:hypothetical protein
MMRCDGKVLRNSENGRDGGANYEKEVKDERVSREHERPLLKTRRKRKQNVPKNQSLCDLNAQTYLIR